MKKTTLLGLMAVASTMGYLWLRSREEEGSEPIEGLEIRLNPETLIDSALSVSRMNPSTKEGIRKIAHNALNRYYDN